MYGRVRAMYATCSAHVHVVDEYRLGVCVLCASGVCEAWVCVPYVVCVPTRLCVAACVWLHVRALAHPCAVCALSAVCGHQARVCVPCALCGVCLCALCATWCVCPSHPCAVLPYVAMRGSEARIWARHTQRLATGYRRIAFELVYVRVPGVCRYLHTWHGCVYTWARVACFGTRDVR